MRILGLVRRFNSVRAQLQAGVPEDEVEAFRTQVRETVRQVESLCRRHRVSPDQLPGPSRAAYRFLKDLNLENVPARQPVEAPGGFSSVTLKNAARVERHLAQIMWDRLPKLAESSHEQTQLHGEICRHAAAAEDICARQGATPSALPAPSRKVYCWLKFLSDRDNLAVHLGALQRASQVLAEAGPGPQQPVRIYLLHMGSLWRTQHSGDAALLRANEGFVHADGGVWRAIVRCSLAGRDRASDQVIREFAESEDFSEVAIEVESCAELPAGSARGRVHDLAESFDRVNRSYFGRSMPKPRLVWSRTLTRAKLGHYRTATDTVMVAVTLDDSAVPAAVVDFVMYHELLHKSHGATVVNGRLLVHTPQFRADERRFADYEQAKRYLASTSGPNRPAADLIRP